MGNGLPQAQQNLASSTFLVPHLGQNMGFSLPFVFLPHVKARPKATKLVAQHVPKAKSPARAEARPRCRRPLAHVDNKKAPPHQRDSTDLGSCGESKPPKARVPPLATCKIASILQIPPFRMPLRDNKAKNSPRFGVFRAKTGAVPCFNQLVKTFTLLNTLDFARRRRGYLCPRQDMEADYQPTGKFVSAAPTFPLPSATLAKRVSDRERKGRGEQPAM